MTPAKVLFGGEAGPRSRVAYRTGHAKAEATERALAGKTGLKQ
jgi:hypothetical protein